MKTYEVTDGYGVSEEIMAGTATDAAQSYVDTGDYHAENETVWVKVYVQELGEDEEPVGERDWIKIAIDPEEPECTHDEHDWKSPISLVGGLTENPGVFGHEGGVIIHEVCTHCGTEKITDTWAQDCDDGEQGLDSVEYIKGKYADDV